MGADELFYGYAGHQISLLSAYLNHFPSGLSRSMAKLFASLNAGRGHFKPYKRFLQKLGKYQGQGSLNYGFLNIVGDYQNSLSVLTKSNGSAMDIFKTYFENCENTFDAITQFEFNNFLVKNLHYFDRMCMANSVEGRVPFLDYRLVEFAFSLPCTYKLSTFGKSKKILKDTFKPHIPDYIMSRRKAGFGMPLRSIFSDPDKVDGLLDFDFIQDLGYFSKRNIDRLIKTHQDVVEDN